MTTATLQAIGNAERKLAGARYDLTRTDKHPNDVYKARAKLAEAAEMIGKALEIERAS